MSAPFSKVLQALVEQYEQDVADAYKLALNEKLTTAALAERGHDKDVPICAPSILELAGPAPPPTGPPTLDDLEEPSTPLPHSVAGSHSDTGALKRVGTYNSLNTVNSSLKDELNASKGGALRSAGVASRNDIPVAMTKNTRTSRSSTASSIQTHPSVKLADLNVVKRFVLGSLFDKISAFLLIGNAAFIGVQVETSFSDVTPLWINLIDWLFCLAFIVELSLRIYGFGCSKFWCSKADRAWNQFDFVIVLLSTLDTVISIAASGADSPLGNISVLRVIRIVRITRVLRIIRVMKFFQDLRIMVAAIASTLKTASFAFGLIMFTMYMFGIAITQMVAEHVKDMRDLGTPIASDDDMMLFFGGIAWTIFTLFMTIAGGIDWRDAVIPLMETGALALIFYLCYVGLMILCVMNVLTGIFCQSAIDTAASDKESIIQLHLKEKDRFIETLQGMFATMDENESGSLKIEDFRRHLSEENMQAILRSLEIEVRDAMTLFELLDTDLSGEVDIEEFVTGCITLRGGAKAVHMEKVSSMNKILNLRFDLLDEAVLGIKLILQGHSKELDKLMQNDADYCEA